MAEVSRIAITGMACIFPGARDLNAYLTNLNTGYDAITEVPENRWENVFYDPNSQDIDRFYCHRGGFIDTYATFDPLFFGIMPIAAEGAEPDQLLTLKVSHDALMDAGYDTAKIPGKRTGIIIGRGNYIGAEWSKLEQRVRTAQQLVAGLKTLIPDISDKEIARIKTDFQSRYGHFGSDTAIGIVPNLTASRVANRLDLHGPAYTIDAACASSLIAIDQAVKTLQSKQCDLMLAGGVHVCQTEVFWSVFTQLGILSKTCKIKPFDADADGVLIGEGVGVVVLKRYEDAVNDGDRIYAVINGIGVSSDGKSSSLMQPSVNGQIAALENAWKMSGLKPDHIGYIEGHGTGAPTGDTSELNTLSQFFTNLPEIGRKVGLGSVKSMIGHCMPAAGIAGVIKTSLSLYHKKIFPSLHCSRPHNAIHKTGFRIPDKAEDWDFEGFPRIAGVNAFGFGGINAHVVMSEHEKEISVLSHKSLSRGTESQKETVLLISAWSQQSLLDALAEKKTTLMGGPYRLVVFEPDAKKLDKAKKIIQIGSPWRGRGDIYYSSDGLLEKGGKVAFLFPGVDNLSEPKLKDVEAFFNKPLPEYESILTGLGKTSLDIIRSNHFLYEILTGLGVKPDVVAGHSIGEWSGMIATGIVDSRELGGFIQGLTADLLEMPDVAFAATGCDIHTAESFIADLDDIGVSNDNCPHQVILCGKDASIDITVERMEKKGILCQKLSFRSGFHSPLFADFLNRYKENMGKKLTYHPRNIPLWSATTCSPYPVDRKELDRLFIDHLIKPVRFRELILKLYQEGNRVFIQIGAGRLSGFVQDTLKGKAFSAVDTNTARKTGMQQLRRALAACFIEGMEADLAALGMVDAPAAASAGVNAREMTLKLGVPMVRFKTPLDIPHTGNFVSKEVTIKDNNHPVINAFQETMSGIALMQENVIDCWQTMPGSVEGGGTSTKRDPELPIKKKTFELDLSVKTCPWLIDHSLFPQSESCTNLYEKFPCVPMTMSVDIIREYAQKMAPGKKVVSIEKIQAFTWMDVTTPLKLEIEAEYVGLDKIRITAKGYVTGIACVSDCYPDAPKPEPYHFINKRSAPITVEHLYNDRWMFHGPAYQGVTEIGPMADNGICGTITSAEGRGSLLDNAGQLFCVWLMFTAEVNKVALPMDIGKIRFFSDPPAHGEKVECKVKCHPVEKNATTSDMELFVAGHLWATVTHWRSKRFEIDNTLYSMLRHPGTKILSSVEKNGVFIYRYENKTASGSFFISKRYCTEFEKNLHDRIAPKEKRKWLTSLIVVKDAVKHMLFNQGVSPVYPNEISLKNYETFEKCEAVGPSGETFEISCVCQGEWGAAVVTSYRAVNGDVIRIPGMNGDLLNDSLIGLLSKKIEEASLKDK